ncbi:MAG TPA: FAD-dependent oxidoreductase [Acidimicrobiales bacterium]|nr:FAD-dependent oxidoreductase [Acidimicrobiales bacterium]
MPERLVVIGGDAAGMSAASQARRRRPDDLEIVALEKGSWTSYSACGIPYLVGGDVASLDDLVARSPQTFRDAFRIDVRLRSEAMAIDLDARTVEVRDHEHDRTYALGFDVLHIATGAHPMRPPLPGIDGADIHGVQTLDDAAHLLDHVTSKQVDIRESRVVIVGGGYIGLEMAEAFVRRGADTTVVTSTAQPLNLFDPDIGELVGDAMRAHGITVRCNERVTTFEETGRRTTLVHTDAGDPPIEADLVVLGMGVGPNAGLARDAGLATGDRGAISTDRRQRTSAEGVYAAGDCCESFDRVTGRRVYVALGTVANKQGRVAGINIGGGYATFPGVIGTAVTKLCALEVARTGVSEREAVEAGFEYVAVTIDSTTRAGYFPGTQPIRVKMLAEKKSGHVIGAQIIGQEGAAKRIDVIATAITAGMTADEMTALDLSYAPPFAPVWDPVLIAARKAAEALADAGQA